MFQTPHIGGYLSQEVEEDLKITRLFYYVANYNIKKMEHTRIKLLGLKTIM